MHNILLGVTGSVAATLTVKIFKALQQLGEVRVVATKCGEQFLRNEDKLQIGEVYLEEDEWPDFYWEKDDPIMHIELRKWASALVIAPLSANTLAKMVHGICDNLLTSVFRAWDHQRPIIVAPAMNSIMWENCPTGYQIETLKNWGIQVVPPQSKILACGDEGVGAMADISKIVEVTAASLVWDFPLKTVYGVPTCSGIPINHHPGAFGFHRKHNFHTGVDLYTEDKALVSAVESGRIVKLEQFTGPEVGHEWWEKTWGLMIEGASGVVNYGEISVPSWVKVGDKIEKGQYIGNVKRVLFPDRLRPDIPGHSCSMLHIELYKHGVRDFSGWEDPAKNPDLLDPTPYLIKAKYAPNKTLTWDNPEGKEVG
jgi:phosphopantothenoylcysteine decarboxylase